MALGQASRVFNVLYEFSANSLLTQLAVLPPGPSITAPVTTALKRLSGAGAIGASVNTTTLQPTSACAKAGVSSPCVKVGFSVQSKSGSLATNQVGFAVTDKGVWYVSRASACRIPAPGSTSTPTHSICG